MDLTRRILVKKITESPGQALLCEALETLEKYDQLVKSTNSEERRLTERLKERLFVLLHRLESDGTWGKDADETEALKLLKEDMQSSPTIKAASSDAVGVDHGRDISIVIPPPSPTIMDGMPWHDLIGLPLEVIDQLNQTYFLHLLATSPQAILPPGKSLLSVLSRPHTQHAHDPGNPQTLHQKVEEIAHKAFWDEALETLSEPTPSKQLSRLGRLYADLYPSIAPLLPSTHPVLKLFSSPLSPTSAPLLSAARHLRELLTVLKTRSAPARDEEIDRLIKAIDEMPIPGTIGDRAKVVVDTVKGILQLSEVMKSDMTQFVLGQLSEDELHAEIIHHAQGEERAVVLALWSEDAVNSSWIKWINQLDNHRNEDGDKVRWIGSLIHALGTNVPVSCPLPVQSPVRVESNLSIPDENSLPPPFLFTQPTLLRIQNALQALVVAAALRVLVKPKPFSSSNSTLSTDHAEAVSTGGTFMERVWALLKIEIDEQAGSGDTKLINLADEVIREHRFNHTSSTGESSVEESEERRIRDSVDRTLKPQDPVFLLLQKRLLRAIASRLSSSFMVSATQIPGVPTVMRTGGERKRLKLEHSGGSRVGANVLQHGKNQDPLVVKGFEDPVLLLEVSNVTREITDIILWIQRVWCHDIEGVL